MKMKLELTKILVVAVTALSFVFVVGCESDAMSGAAIGSLAGAGIGQLAGRSTESTLIGAAVGGGVGYVLGNEGDKKKAEAHRYELEDEMNTVTVNVTNSNGSIVPVRLRRHGVGYVGPRGEYYPDLPRSEQLRPVYGF